MRTTFALVLGLCPLVVSGCSSAPEAAAERDAAGVGALPPAACRLAVVVTQTPSATAKGDGLRFTKDAVGLRDAIVAHLGRLKTATVVYGVADADAAKPAEADILLNLQVSANPPVHRGMSSGWWSSGLLWIVTWIGGLLTDDSTYGTDLRVEGTLAQVGVASDTLGTITAQSGNVDLSYWDRNTVASWRFLQSLVLPPFWTTDDPELTSRALTDQATKAAAVQIAGYVKRQLEADARNTIGQFTLIEPATNGAEVDGATASLRFSIESTAEISALGLTVAGKRQELALPAKMGIPGGYSCAPAPVAVDLRPGDNQVQIEARVGNKRFARTVLIRRKT